MVEKRRCHRMSIELPVSFQTGPDSIVISSTLDISATGIALVLKEPVTVGRVIHLTVGVAKGRTIKVDAQVIWVKDQPYLGACDYQVGLKIVDKMDKDEIEFVRFVARKMLDYFKEQKNADS